MYKSLKSRIPSLRVALTCFESFCIFPKLAFSLGNKYPANIFQWKSYRALVLKEGKKQKDTRL